MKRFLLMAGENYYPQEGTADWIDSFSSKEEAEAAVVTEVIGIKEYASMGQKKTYQDIRYKVCGKPYDWYQIVDLETWTPGERSW